MDKRFLGILSAIIIIFAAIFVVSQHSSGKNGSGSSASNTQPTSHITGQGSSGVTLVEYGDYQCPICGEYYSPLQQVVAQFNSQIYFQFRNLPLTSIHPNAFAAARAAEAAGMQNKYWQMHDLLYQQNVAYYASNEALNNWVGSTNPLSYFTTYAKQLGLNVSKFTTDYNSDQANNSINADLNAFAKTNQEEATPTFFLDGVYLPNTAVADNNGPSVEKFAQVLNAEIAKKNPSSKQ